MGVVSSGDITQITVNNTALGISATWPIKANSDGTFDPGGFRNNDDDDQVDGGGRLIMQKNRKRWSFEGTMTWDMNTANELETARQIAAAATESDFTVTHCNGTVWAGKGTVVGDLKGNSNTGELPIKLAGGGRMEKIVG